MNRGASMYVVPEKANILKPDLDVEAIEEEEDDDLFGGLDQPAAEDDGD